MKNFYFLYIFDVESPSVSLPSNTVPHCPVKYRGLKVFSVSKNGGRIFFFLLEFVSTLQ